MYIRMLVMMVIAFYTSRILLEALGIDDYGIYNVVGGVVLLFSFINNAMSNASQRFLSFELGKKESAELGKVFSMSMNCHIIISFIILILSETIGLWYVNSKLNLPPDSNRAAFLVYQFSILTCIINILRVPFNASIISYEKMSFYAYVSIIEALLKLGVVFLIMACPRERLVLYSVLITIVNLIVFLLFGGYCFFKLSGCRYERHWEKKIFKNLMGFSGLSMINGFASISSLQGLNIMLNSFFGVAVNAAYGIAMQVSNAVYQFVSNFQISFQPQIVKFIAKKDYGAENLLIIRASKLSFFLLFVIFLPLAYNMEGLLEIWLKNVPQYSARFSFWMIMFLLVDAIQGPVWMAVYGTGKIRDYTIWTSVITLSNLPISYIILFIGCNPVSVLIVRFVINMVCSAYRLYCIKSLIDFPVIEYLKMVIFKAFPVCIVTSISAYFFRQIFSESIDNIILTSVLIFLCAFLVIWTIGLTKNERSFFKKIISENVQKFIRI